MRLNRDVKDDPEQNRLNGRNRFLPADDPFRVEGPFDTPPEFVKF